MWLILKIFFRLLNYYDRYKCLFIYLCFEFTLLKVEENLFPDGAFPVKLPFSTQRLLHRLLCEYASEEKEAVCANDTQNMEHQPDAVQ